MERNAGAHERAGMEGIQHPRGDGYGQEHPDRRWSGGRFGNEIEIDNFAGCGGASEGIQRATGRPVAIAINHDEDAIVLHSANHPQTRHYRRNIRDVRPAEIARRNPIRLAWFSPDCRHHSKAKGRPPIRTVEEKNSRDLAWVVIDWAREARPRIIMLENVEEWVEWGPLGPDGRADRARKGETFKAWLTALRNAGYDRIEWRELRACDFGDPTWRKRLFLVARRDGRPIRWPEPTHGPGRKRYRTIAECIDWSLPVHSIFMSKEDARKVGCRRPLAENTMRRIAKGMWKYVINNPDPFIVGVTHATGSRAYPLGEPLRTVTAAHRGEFAIVAPKLEPAEAARREQASAAFIMRHFGNSVGHGARAPLGTVTASGGGKSALVMAHMSHQYTSNTCGGQGDPRSPAKTITTGGHAALVQAFMIGYYSTGGTQDADCAQPMPTQSTRDRFGLVMVEREAYRIVDIGMRMLTPRELFRAQGFPEHYVIDAPVRGKTMSKTKQIWLCGNVVCPGPAEALVRANIADETGQGAHMHAA